MKIASSQCNSAARSSGFVLVLALSLLLLSVGTLFFFMLLVQNQTRTEYASMQSRFALISAESGINETMQYLLWTKTGSTQKTNLTVAASERWVTNDGRYEWMGFPTNAEFKILAESVPLNTGRTFYVAGYYVSDEKELELYSLGGAYPLHGTNPIVKLIRVKSVYGDFTSQGVLQGELITTEKLLMAGNAHAIGTNSNLSATNTTTSNAMTVISMAYPNHDVFEGSNTISGNYVIASPDLPSGLHLPEAITNAASISNSVVTSNDLTNNLIVGTPEFLADAKQGYETNHFITRQNCHLFPPVDAPAESVCKDAPVVNIGTEAAPIMVYQFEASGDYKITTANLYPLILKTGVVVNLLLPAGYVLSEPTVTMEGDSKLTLFPLGDVTLGAKSFAAVEKNFARLTVWGGTNQTQKMTFLGNPETLLCARVYAPYSDLILTNNLSISGLMVGKTISMASGTVFWGDEHARTLALGEASKQDTNFILRVKEWEEIPVTKE